MKPEFSGSEGIEVKPTLAVPQWERVFNMGAADYFAKPLSATSLRKAFASILCRKRCY